MEMNNNYTLSESVPETLSTEGAYHTLLTDTDVKYLAYLIQADLKARRAAFEINDTPSTRYAYNCAVHAFKHIETKYNSLLNKVPADLFYIID